MPRKRNGPNRGIKTARARAKLHRKDPHCHYCRVKLINNADPKYREAFGIKPDGRPKIYDGYKGLYWSATVDHKVPYQKGGRHTHRTGPENRPNYNLVLACVWCNTRKGDMDYEEFMASEMLAWRMLYLHNLHIRLAEQGLSQESVTVVDLLKELWDDKSWANNRIKPENLPTG